jgi:hypothetical protein
MKRIHGIGCNASTKGALNMTKLGFNRDSALEKMPQRCAKEKGIF